MTEGKRVSAGSLVVFTAALVTTLLTVPLLSLGASVTSYGVGMAVPDWPTTFGENMLTYNFFADSFGVKIEHLHRLLGVCVGIAAIGLTIAGLTLETNRSLKILCSAVLLAVICQGLLGGFRVTLNAILGPKLAWTHGAFGQLTFGLMVATTTLLSPAYRRSHFVTSEMGPAVARLFSFLAGLVFLQIIVGGALRHMGMGTWIHVGGAVAVFLLAMYACLVTWLDEVSRRALFGSTIALSMVLMLQMILGLATLLVVGVQHPGLGGSPTHFAAGLATVHVVMAAALFATSIVVCLMARKSLLPLATDSALVDHSHVTAQLGVTT